MAGHPARKTKWMRPSIDKEESSHVHKPWDSWGTSTTSTSVGGTMQKHLRRFQEGIDNNFLLPVIEQLMRRGAMLDIALIIREVVVGNMKLSLSL